MSHFPTKLSQYGPYLFLGMVCSGFMLIAFMMGSSVDLYSALRFDREFINSGELWRLISGHFLHTNIIHWLVNMMGLALLWMLHGDYTTPKNFTLNIVILCIGISICISLWSSDINWYVGLSGVLHGLFLWGVVIDIHKGRKTGFLLLIGAVLKLFEEQVSSNASGLMSELIEANIAVDAHLYGAVIGLVLGIITIAIQSSKKK